MATNNPAKRKIFETSVPLVAEKKSTPPATSTATSSSYCQGQPVYVRTTDQTWVRAVVVSVSCQQTISAVTAQVDGTDQVVSCSTDEVLLRSDQQLEKCDNLTMVAPINEATVLHCLHERFMREEFYTYAGTTVIAVNPFHDIGHLYTMEQIQAYHNKAKGLPPHIYPVAEAAYTCLVRELGKVNQSIVVSGESGAGKTVSAKHLLKYLTVVSHPKEIGDQISKDLHNHKGVKIEQRILDSNPILEAFGNAATPRNNNSSRFGKFIELQFLRMGHIQGGAIQTYLLEKTRVVHQGLEENNFHVFYQMTGLSPDKQYPSWLEPIQKEAKETAFTCVPHNQEIENGDIQETLDAMTDIGLSQERQQAVFQVLLAVLYLGNLRFLQISDDESSDLDCSLDTSSTSMMSDDSCVELEVSETERALERSCQLLGLSPARLRQTLLHRCIQPGGRQRQSVFVKPVGITEAQSRRDCLAMLLYSRLFDWLVGFINHQIHAEFFENTIGLLDIYGFEAFEVNSLEQLCINYANERLQQHYVTNFLHQLQVEYQEECIPWTPIDYNDNRPCVEILDGRSSIFGVLNEEVYLNRKSNDHALKARIFDLKASSQGYLRPARPTSVPAPSFVVQHYAGNVTYCISGLLTKNRDDIPSDLVALLLASENPFVGELFCDFQCADSPGKKKKTVLTKFKSSLDDLMSSLITSDIHYVRCLKPNEQNLSGVFQPPYVLEQLRACGAIETVDICRRGYPARMPYNEFQHRYNIILRHQQCLQSFVSPDLPSDDECYKENVCESLDELLKQQLDMPRTPKRTQTPRKRLRRRTGLTQHDHARKVCASVLQVVFGTQGSKAMCHQFGHTKLFLLENQLEDLERARAEVFKFSAVSIQRAWRNSVRRQHFKRFLAAARIQRAWHAHCTRMKYRQIREAIFIIQTFTRQWLSRRRAEEERQRRLLAASLTTITVESQELTSGFITADTLSDRQGSSESDTTLVGQKSEAGDVSKVEDLVSDSQEACPLRRGKSFQSVGDRNNGGDFTPSTCGPVVSSPEGNFVQPQRSPEGRVVQPPFNVSDMTDAAGDVFASQVLGPCSFQNTQLFGDGFTVPAGNQLVKSVSDNPIRREQAAGDISFSHKTVQPSDKDSPSHSLASSSRRLSGSLSDSPLNLSNSPARSQTFGDHDLSGNLSDDSGVMVHEPLPATRVKVTRIFSRKDVVGPPEKRQRLAAAVQEYPDLRDVHVGDGLVTRRRIPKYGSRFHTKASVLKYGHLTNRRDLPAGLPDVLPDADGSSVD